MKNKPNCDKIYSQIIRKEVNIMTEKKELKLEEIDERLKLPTEINKNDIVFYDIRKSPFEIYGLYSPQTPGDFLRMPREVAEATSPGVESLNKRTAGGRVRFSTDSNYVAIKVTMPSPSHMYHMAFSGSAGFDIYRDTDSGSYFCGVLSPAVTFKGGEFETYVELYGEGMRSYTIHFPTYSGFTEMYIGVQETARVTGGAKYAYDKPILYYGSSITEGGCSSRPGTAYESIISRKLNVDHINLGFSGSGKGEKAIADYMAGLDPLIFVSDYDHNAPNIEHLENTHYEMYRTIRRAHPDLPYVMISKPDFIKPHSSIDGIKRRDVIHRSFMKGIESGDKNLYFIDGESFFSGYADAADCTVDGCHPTDLGFYLMAERIGFTIKNILMRM